MRRLILILTAMLLVMGFMDVSISADVDTPSATGTDLSGFTSVTIDGTPIDGDIFGQSSVTVLHYFATWSAQCITEIQHMQRLFESYDGSVNVIGILHEDSQSTTQEALRLFNEYGIEYECVVPDKLLNNIVTLYSFIPQTFIVSCNGIVLEHFPGAFESYASLREHVENWIGWSEPVYTLEFYDGLTGLIVARQQVVEGTDAVLPTAPEHPGYAFSSWDGNYTNIHASGIVYALYNFIGPEPHTGDVDVDGQVNIMDSLLASRHILGFVNSPSVELYGDINSDGETDIADALLILRIALGLE